MLLLSIKFTGAGTSTALKQIERKIKMNAYEQIKAAAKNNGVDVSELTIQTSINGIEIDPAEKIDIDTAKTYDDLDAWTADVRDTVEADNCDHEAEGTDWNITIATKDGKVITCGSAYSEDND